jgi:hypothetical protein
LSSKNERRRRLYRMMHSLMKWSMIVIGRMQVPTILQRKTVKLNFVKWIVKVKKMKESCTMRYGSGKDDVLVWKILKDGEYVSLHEATFVLPDHYGAFSPIFVAIAINREIRLGINLFCRTVRMGDNPKKMRDVRKVGSLVETYG